MFDCGVIEKRGRILAYGFERTMEDTGASDEGAPPTNMKKKDLTKCHLLEAISLSG